MRSGVSSWSQMTDVTFKPVCRENLDEDRAYSVMSSGSNSKNVSVISAMMSHWTVWKRTI